MAGETTTNERILLEIPPEMNSPIEVVCNVAAGVAGQVPFESVPQVTPV